jgi:hypothetical protein
VVVRCVYHKVFGFRMFVSLVFMLTRILDQIVIAYVGTGCCDWRPVKQNRLKVRNAEDIPHSPTDVKNGRNIYFYRLLRMLLAVLLERCRSGE